MHRQRSAAWIATGLVGIALGAGSAWIAIAHAGFEPVADTPAWRFDRLAGAPEAGAYTRARVAYAGLLALSRREAVYYFTRTDSDGAALDEHCVYRLRGGAFPSRWWSLTLYDEE